MDRASASCKLVNWEVPGFKPVEIKAGLCDSISFWRRLKTELLAEGWSSQWPSYQNR